MTTREGLLLCIAPGAAPGVPTEFTRHVETVLGSDQDWQAGIGRAHPGPGGILRSYEEARDTLELAGAMGLDRRVLNASDLLVFEVLFRDRAAIIDLVGSVLSPLQNTCGGARPLLDTLAAYFSEGEVPAAAARRLYLSVRAFTYLLNRIEKLTGSDPREPRQRFTLEAAVLGARLLDWPDQPLPDWFEIRLRRPLSVALPAEGPQHQSDHQEDGHQRDRVNEFKHGSLLCQAQ